jgi:hypothetical protein
MERVRVDDWELFPLDKTKAQDVVSNDEHRKQLKRVRVNGTAPAKKPMKRVRA